LLTDDEVKKLGKDPNATYGVSPSPDAIGGYFGMGWVQHFTDHKTGEVYGVHCSDGVYGGKSAHHPKHEVWMHAVFDTISGIGHRSGIEVIEVPTLEWNLMSNYTHRWMDGGKETGEAPGEVGTCNGIKVMVRDDAPTQVGLPPDIKW
jgi:hypothetical protein